MKIVVFGAGYVGLVTGAGLSDLGHEVLVVDVDEAKIDRLRNGEVPIYEPGLGDLIARNVRARRMRFAKAEHVVEAAFADADAYFICVGTPPKDDGSADVSAVLECAERIGKVAEKTAVVVVKSTVPVGTCDAVQASLDAASKSVVSAKHAIVHGPPLEAVSNPEFLKEGDALNDFFKPDRIVVGARSERARDVMRRLYAPLNLSGERPMLFMDPRSSELVKYASNAMLAVRISFMNEIARLCDAAGANVHDVRIGMGADSRIGKKFLYPGPGYGGSCFPKDVKALSAMGRHHGVHMRLPLAADLANKRQANYVASILAEAIGGAKGKKVAIWGLSFKPETDDVREAPSVRIAKLLWGEAQVVGHDPEAGPNFMRALPGWNRRAVSLVKPEQLVVDRELDALDGAHALVLLTEWRCYRSPDWAEVARRMAPGAVVVDARNIWRAEDVVRARLRYRGIGVPGMEPEESMSSGVAISRLWQTEEQKKIDGWDDEGLANRGFGREE